MPEAGGRPLRVCVDARMASGAGGTEQFILNLAESLCSLDDGHEEYLFLCHEAHDEWLRPYVRGAGRIVHPPAPGAPPRVPKWRQIAKRLVPATVALANWWRSRHFAPVPQSDGFVEAIADVMHFTKQDGFMTALPSIYHPHDLQHVHLPQFFSKADVREREYRYRVLCEQAETVLVNSEWVRNDVIEHFGLSADKVQVVNLAAFFSAPAEASAQQVSAAKARYHLPEKFVFYPAQTWPHKNHLNLLAALALLKDRDGLAIPLVCTGTKNAYYAEIEKRARELGIDNEVRFLGFIDTVDLSAVYRSATAQIVPTRFEAGSGPIWEAFALGVPVACSNVTSLPAQVGDAALVFDPDDIEEMAAAIRLLWCDADLRETLIAKGRANIARYDRNTTARLFRAHYRRVGGTATPEDIDLLSKSSAY